MESGIGTKLERNGTIALAFGLKPVLRSDYISHAQLPTPRSAPLTFPGGEALERGQRAGRGRRPGSKPAWC